MTPEQITYYQDIAMRLDQAKYGDKTNIIRDITAYTGLNRTEIYRNLKLIGYDSGRKTRKDKGTSSIDLEDVKKICFFMDSSRRDNNKRLMKCKQAIDILYANGDIKERYNASTIFRLARMHNCHPDQLVAPAPYQDLRSLYPNHVWQVDASICIIFYLPKGGVQTMDIDEFYKNKPKNLMKVANERVIRYVMTDHTTGMIYVKYYVGSGETQEILFDFLVSSFLPKERHPMHGVPFILGMDKGSANISHAIKTFLTRMQINHYAHSTGNSRAKGSVEVSQNIVERGFEHLTRKKKHAIQNVDELNHYAMYWQLHFNSTEQHSRHGMTRTNAWLKIKEEQLRIAPFRETMETLLTTKPVERTVAGNLRIQYTFKVHDEPFFYSLKHIECINVNDKVLVSENPFKFPNVFVITTDIHGKETYHECSPSEKDDWNFYADGATIGEEMKSMPDTPQVKMQKESFQAQYPNASTQEEAKKQRKKRVAQFGGDIDPFKHIQEELQAQENVTIMPKRGTALAIDKVQQVLENMPVAELCALIKTKLGDRYPEDTYMVLSKKYPDGADPLEVNNIASWLITRSQLQVVNS